MSNYFLLKRKIAENADSRSSELKIGLYMKALSNIIYNSSFISNTYFLIICWSYTFLTTV